MPSLGGWRARPVVATILVALAVLGLTALVVLVPEEPHDAELRTSAGEGAALAVPVGADPSVPTSTLGTAPPLPPTTARASASTTRTTPSTTRPAPSPATALACRDSEDPACGEFRWDPPPPPNQPMRVTVELSHTEPVVGEVVSFHVIAEDPDGQYMGDSTIGYGEGPPWGLRSHPDCLAGYGPWTPPTATPGRVDETYRHAYSTPGTFTATFHFRSYGPCPDPSIYSSEGQASVTVAVSSSSSDASS